MWDMATSAKAEQRQGLPAVALGMDSNSPPTPRLPRASFACDRERRMVTLNVRQSEPDGSLAAAD